MNMQIPSEVTRPVCTFPATAGHLSCAFTCAESGARLHCGGTLRVAHTAHWSLHTPQFKFPKTYLSHSELLYMDPAKSSAILSTCGIADAAATGSVHLCRHHAGSDFGHLALRRLLSAPHHASD